MLNRKVFCPSKKYKIFFDFFIEKDTFFEKVKYIILIPEIGLSLQIKVFFNGFRKIKKN